MRRCRLATCRLELPKVKDSDSWQRLGVCNQDHYYQHESTKRSMKAQRPYGTKARPKLKSLAKVREDLAVLLQKLVRLKAADEFGYCQCVTCEKRYHWKEMQGGHFIERGKIATKIIEENINPQCPYCNQHGMKQVSTMLKYRQWMIDMHGVDFVEWLRAEAGRIVKHRRDELEDQISQAKAQIAELESSMETRRAA